MREEYIKNVKGGRLKRLSAFLGDRDWNAEGGVSFSFANEIFMPCIHIHIHKSTIYIGCVCVCMCSCVVCLCVKCTHMHVYAFMLIYVHN